MLKKIDAAALSIYTRGYCFVQGLKEDERGLSDVVVAVLLILVGVLVVAMLWNSLSGWLGQLWSKITGAGDIIKDVDPSGGL